MEHVAALLHDAPHRSAVHAIWSAKRCSVCGGEGSVERTNSQLSTYREAIGWGFESWG
jgi:hypothetical protein